MGCSNCFGDFTHDGRPAAFIHLGAASSVVQLQSALNRFSTILGAGSIAVDGVVGKNTSARLQQVVAAFVTNLWSAVFQGSPTGGLLDYTSIDDQASYLATALNDFADGAGLGNGVTKTARDVPPTPAQKTAITTAIQAAGAPALASWYSSPWLLAGVLAVGVGTLGWAVWKRKKKSRR